MRKVPAHGRALERHEASSSQQNVSLVAGDRCMARPIHTRAFGPCMAGGVETRECCSGVRSPIIPRRLRTLGPSDSTPALPLAAR